MENGSWINFTDSQNISGELEEDAWLRSVLYGIRWCFLPVIVAGTITNCLNFVVLSHKDMRSSSTGVYLCALAAADLGVMYFELFRVWFEWIQLVPPELYFSDTYCKLANFSNDVARDYSNWLVACLTLERVVMMMNPYCARRLSTVKLAHRVIFFLLGLMCVLHVHTLIVSTALRRVGWVCWEDPNLPLGQVLAAAIEFIIGYVVVIVVFILNLIMIIAIYRYRLPHTSLPGGSVCRVTVNHSRNTANRRLTRTLIVVALVFVACETPRMVSAFVSKYFSQRTPVKRIVHNISFFISGINHACNFFIYILSSPRFRQLFLESCRNTCNRKRRNVNLSDEFALGVPLRRSASTVHRWMLQKRESVELEQRAHSTGEQFPHIDKNNPNLYVKLDLKVYVSSGNDSNSKH